MKKPNTYLTEKVLLEALLSKNDIAFEILYNNYAHYLFGIISMILIDEETKINVLQKVIIKIWFSIDQYNPDRSKLFIWMINLAHKCAIEELKFRNRISNYLEPTRAGFLKALKADEFSVFKSIYLEGNKVEETALAMFIHPDEVKKVLRRAITNLCLNPKISQN